MFPWAIFTQKPKATTPREIMLIGLRNGVPAELACRAVGILWENCERRRRK